VYQQARLVIKMTTTSSLSSFGSPDCPCIDTVPVLEPFSNCNLADGSKGINNLCSGSITANANCKALTMGRSCRIHDLGGKIGECTVPNPEINTMCSRHWCYVDVEKCRKSNSKIAYYKSNSFQGMYYSMMTCNPDLGYIPDPETWSGKNEKFENYNTPNLVASIPGSVPFEHFIEGMDEMNFDIPELRADGGKYQGLYIDYFINLIKLEKGLESVDFVTRSQSSSFLLPSSSYDAAARDVQVGLSDIAVGSFWTTPERLLWTAFTTPLFEDEIRLVVKMNSNGPQNFIDKAKKNYFSG